MHRVALTGAGGMARTHAAAYAALDATDVAAVMDIDPERARALAGVHGAAAYSDFDRTLEEIRPDIVDVCVPTPFHAEYVVRAAAAKPQGIVVEKPMGRTVDECDRMIAACRSAGVPLFVAHVLRFFPEFAAARAQVEAGAVGTPAVVRTRRGGSFPRATNNWYARFEQSGGAVLDLIIHDFDWLRWTFGDVERVFAKGMAARIAPGQEMDKDYALVTLRFRSGVMAHVEGTWADPGGFKVALEVAGDQGLLEYNFNQPAGAPLQIARAAADTGGPGVAVPESPLATSPYQLELAHFVDHLDSGTPLAVSPEDGREAVRIALAALESIQTGRPVAL